MKNIPFRTYIAKQGLKPVGIWKLPTGYYAQIKGSTKSAKGFTQILQGGTVVRLSPKDVSNPDIVGKDTTVIFENKITKTELRTIIKEELKRLSEGYSGSIGPSIHKTVDAATKYWEKVISDSKKHGGQFRQFRGVKYLGKIDDADEAYNTLDRQAIRNSDQYILIAQVGKEVWEAYERRN